MKAQLALTLLIAGFMTQAAAQVTKLILPETGIAITLNATPTAKPGEGFRSITIISNGTRNQFTPKDPFLRIPNSNAESLKTGVWPDINGLKPHSSHLFLLGHFTVDSRPHTLLFFLGGAGFGAAPVLVVGFFNDGRPYKVLERSELDVTSFEVANDGARIIGKSTLSEVMGGDGWNGSKAPYATTYDPFSIYLVHPSSPAVYSLAESRAYNQEHYVWAGPRFRDDFAVLYNIPGHRRPFGALGSKVDGILARAGAK